MRLSCIGRPLKYSGSFYGIVDLVSILPTYVSLLLPSGKYFLVIRILRLLRVFRVLKLVQYVGEYNYLQKALWASRRKILVITSYSIHYTKLYEARSCPSSARGRPWP